MEGNLEYYYVMNSGNICYKEIGKDAVTPNEAEFIDFLMKKWVSVSNELEQFKTDTIEIQHRNSFLEMENEIFSSHLSEVDKITIRLKRGQGPISIIGDFPIKKPSNLAIEKAMEAYQTTETGNIVVNEKLVYAFAYIVEDILSKPWLGNATTSELLAELTARAKVHGYGGYKTFNEKDFLNSINPENFDLDHEAIEKAGSIDFRVKLEEVKRVKQRVVEPQEDEFENGHIVTIPCDGLEENREYLERLISSENRKIPDLIPELYNHKDCDFKVCQSPSICNKDGLSTCIRFHGTNESISS